MSDQLRNSDTWNDSQDDGGPDVGELLAMIREMETALSWYTSFYNDVQNTAPEYFDLCGDLDAVEYLHTQVQGIRDRSLMLLDEWEAPMPETEIDENELPL